MTSSHLFAFLSLGLLLLNQIILPDSRYYTTAAALFLLTLSDKNYATLFRYRMFTHLLELQNHVENLLQLKYAANYTIRYI